MTNKTPQPLSEEALREKIQDIFNDCTSGWLVTIKDFNGNDRDLGSLENEIINDIVNSIIQERQAWAKYVIGEDELVHPKAPEWDRSATRNRLKAEQRKRNTQIKELKDD